MYKQKANQTIKQSQLRLKQYIIHTRKEKKKKKNTAKNNKTQDRVFSGTKQIEEMVKEGISGTSVKRRNQIGQNTEIQKRKKT
jgi:hypothetical protein